MFLFYIYNFYFENLIYKWIKKFENLQKSNLIFLTMLVEVRIVFLLNYPLILSLLKHKDVEAFFN